MPIIQFDGPVIPREKKVELAAKITKAAQEVFPNIPGQAFTLIIRENGHDNIAVGGQLLSDRLK